MLAFVRAGLADLSVSRPASRAGGWGIPVPGDPDQVVYVWWDALANYVTALADPDDFRRWWQQSDERIHVIGKGIVRFHAVYWLALLLSAGLPLPTAIFVHEYLTADGAKLSKSAGNTVDPVHLVDEYGTDAVRWWLLRDVAAVGDTDFTRERLIRRHNQDLANGLGSLVNRTLTLAHGHRLDARAPAHEGSFLDIGASKGLREPVFQESEVSARIDRALAAFDFRTALDALWSIVDDGNRLIETERPWQLEDARLDTVLSTLLSQCHLAALELRPFLPDGAARLLAQLTGEAPVKPVFPRLEP